MDCDEVGASRSVSWTMLPERRCGRRARAAAGKFGMHADSMVILHEGRELSELGLPVLALRERCESPLPPGGDEAASRNRRCTVTGPYGVQITE